MSITCRLGANGSVLRKREISQPDSDEKLWVAEVMVRKVPDDQQVQYEVQYNSPQKHCL